MIAYLLLLAFAGAEPASTLDVEFRGLRNAKGLVHVCLTQDRAHFPACEKDPHAITATAPAASGHAVIAGFRPGTYAVTLFHDENANNKLDTMMGIPREGFGFSRDAVIRFGPPRYDKVAINISPGIARLRVRLQYLL